MRGLLQGKARIAWRRVDNEGGDLMTKMEIRHSFVSRVRKLVSGFRPASSLPPPFIVASFRRPHR